MSNPREPVIPDGEAAGSTTGNAGDVTSIARGDDPIVEQRPDPSDKEAGTERAPRSTTETPSQ